MRILAIDPGNEQSAYVLWDARRGLFEHNGWKGESFGILSNADLLEMVSTRGKHGDAGSHMAIEMIASYGMAVGREVFDTCVWIGRFVQAWDRSHTLVYRRDVKMHLCGNNSAKDANIRQSLIDRFGPGKDRAIGKKHTPGPLYGVSSDVWAALAVAVTFADGAVRRAA